MDPFKIGEMSIRIMKVLNKRQNETVKQKINAINY